MAISAPIYDAFANDKDIERQRLKRKAFEEMKTASIQKVVANLKLVSASVENPKEFCLLNSLNKPILKSSSCSSNPLLPITALIIQYHSSYPTAEDYNASTDEYFFGLLTLKQQYPLTLITPKTITEKIVGLFTHADVNFDKSKKFSSAYYTLTNEKVKLKQLFDNKNLDALTALKEFEIELRDKECLFRTDRKRISPEAADTFCEGARLLNSVLNS